MSERKHRTYVSRFVYWANTGAAWYDLARAAGYDIDGQHYGDARDIRLLWEARLSWDDRVVAVMRRLPDGEWFGFVFVAQARTPFWRDLVWRIRHPLAPRLPALTRNRP